MLKKLFESRNSNSFFVCCHASPDAYRERHLQGNDQMFSATTNAAISSLKRKHFKIIILLDLHF